MATSTTSAVVIEAAGKAAVKTVPVPKLRDDYILVKVEAVSLNPTDWKHIDFLTSPGARVGVDYAGEVLEAGSKVTKFKKGDRVSGMTHGGNSANHDDGSFGEIITAKAAVQVRMPDCMSFEDAASLGVGIITIGQGFYYQDQGLQLPPLSGVIADSKKRKTLLVYGGSTATGALAIQFAKLSGLHVLATSSPKHFDYLKSLGADEVFDYHSDSVIGIIKAAVANDEYYVFDTISSKESLEICVPTFGPEGGRYGTLLTLPESRVLEINPKVKMTETLAYTAFGENFEKNGEDFPANAEHLEASSRFAEIAEKLIAERKIKPHRIEVNNGGKGLEGVLFGLHLLRKNQVSGKKLVYTVG